MIYLQDFKDARYHEHKKKCSCYFKNSSFSCHALMFGVRVFEYHKHAICLVYCVGVKRFCQSKTLVLTIKMNYIRINYSKSKQLSVSDTLNVLKSLIRRLPCHGMIGQKLYFLACCAPSFDCVCWRWWMTEALEVLITIQHIQTYEHHIFLFKGEEKLFVVLYILINEDWKRKRS